MLVAGLFLGDVSFAVKIFFNSISDDLTLVSSMQIGITCKVFHGLYTSGVLVK